MEVPYQKSCYEKPFKDGSQVTLDSLIMSDSRRSLKKSLLSVEVNKYTQAFPDIINEVE